MPQPTIWDRVDEELGPLTADVVHYVPDCQNVWLEHTLGQLARDVNPLTWLGDMAMLVHFKEWLV